MPNIRGLMTPVAIGAVDAWLRDEDVKKGRTQFTKQWGFFGELAAVLVPYFGVGGGMIGSSTGEDMMKCGAALLSERVTRSFLDKSAGGSFPGAPFTGRSMAGMSGYRPYQSSPMPYAGSAFSTKEPSVTIV